MIPFASGFDEGDGRHVISNPLAGVARSTGVAANESANGSDRAAFEVRGVVDGSGQRVPFLRVRAEIANVGGKECAASSSQHAKDSQADEPSDDELMGIDLDL